MRQVSSFGSWFMRRREVTVVTGVVSGVTRESELNFTTWQLYNVQGTSLGHISDRSMTTGRNSRGRTIQFLSTHQAIPLTPSVTADQA